ncbi:unnamed protein product, partial [Adineta steineri]
DNNNDLSLIRSPLQPPPSLPPPFTFPFDLTSQQNPLFRPSSTTKLSRPAITPSSSSSSSSIKTPTIKREQKPSLFDERIRRTSPSPSSRPTSGSNFLPSSPSHRMRMDFPSLLLPPPPTQHQLPTFSVNDDRRRFQAPNPDLLQSFGASGPNPFFQSFFPMGAPPMPPPPQHMSSSSSSSSRRSGMNSDSSKSSLFLPSMQTPFDFTRSPLLQSGLPLPNN